MKVLLVCRDNIPNPYVYTLEEEIACNGIDVVAGCAKLWDDDYYDIVHFQWPEAVFNWKCLVADDFSTDNTKQLLYQYIKSDRRVIYLLNNHKKDAPGARNTGILAAHGDFVVLFDSGNVMHPTFLIKICEEIKNYEVDICSCFSRVIDATNGNVIGRFEWTGYGRVHSDLMNGKSYFDNSSTVINICDNYEGLPFNR